ncbi:MAG: hypothetical protein V3U54_12815 [Thermodesulfobacteriota bacterium]
MTDETDYWQRREEEKIYMKRMKEVLEPLCELPFVRLISRINSEFIVMKGRRNFTIIANNVFKGFDDTVELYTNEEPKGIYNKWF